MKHSVLARALAALHSKKETAATPTENQAVEQIIKDFKAPMHIRKVIRLPQRNARDPSTVIALCADGVSNIFKMKCREFGMIVMRNDKMGCHVAIKDQDIHEPDKHTERATTITYLTWYGLMVIEASQTTFS